MPSDFGLSAALATPFQEDNSIDLNALEAHVRFCLAEGCNSVTLFGTTGEGASVGSDEKDAIVQHLRLAGVDLGSQVLACVAEDSVENAAARMRAFYQAGIRGVLLCPPHYFKTVPDAGVRAWFDSLFEQLDGMARDVILYHIPGVTGVNVSADLVAELREAWPDVVTGVKDSSGSAAQAEDFISRHGDLDILIGDERLLGDAVRDGARGSISGLANILPGALAEVIAKGQTNPQIVDLVDAVLAHQVVPAVKALIAHATQDPGWLRVRPPLLPQPASSRAQLSDRLAGLLPQPA